MSFSENGLRFDPESVLTTIEMSNRSGGCFLVLFDDEGITGIFAAMVVPNIMDHSQLRAVEYIWHSRPNLPKITRIETMKTLLDHAKMWAQEKNIYLVISASTKKPAVSRILEKEGFSALETSYGRSFTHGN